MAAQIGLKNQIKTNLIYYLNDVLLDGGYYENVSINETDFQSNSMAILVPVDDDGYTFTDTTTRVWQSKLPNWVYESGIAPPSPMETPIVASGVYVENVYKTRSDVTYGHSIDYENGRIIFDTPQNKSLDIQTEFAYKLVRVEFPSKRTELFTSSLFLMNPTMSVPDETQPELTQSLPLLIIEYTGTSFEGLQLGGGKIALPRILLHVVTNDDYSKDDIMDFLARKDDPIIMVNWNVATQPIDYNGDFISGQELFSFKALQANDSIYYHKMFINDVIEKDVDTTGLNFEAGFVDLRTEVRMPEY